MVILILCHKPLYFVSYFFLLAYNTVLLFSRFDVNKKMKNVFSFVNKMSITWKESLKKRSEILEFAHNSKL